MTDTPTIPTQVSYPLQAIARTIIQAGVGALVALLTPIVPSVAGLLSQVQGPMVDILLAVVTAGVAALVAWVMSRPAVNELLTRIHLGATPPDAAAPAYEPAHAVPEDAHAAGVEDGLGTYTEGRGL